MKIQKLNIWLLILCLQTTWLSGQQYYSKTGRITFVSQAPLEKIESYNNNAYVVYDVTNGNMEWSVLIKGFQFQKAVMQQHFNENYLESHKFPKAIFKGNVTNYETVNVGVDGDYMLQVKGNLTLHGITKPFAGTGHLIVRAGKLSLQGAFDITIADYKIEVPKVVRDNVAKTVNVKVSSELQKLN